jgi:Eukaryotic cytochrome b561
MELRTKEKISNSLVKLRPVLEVAEHFANIVNHALIAITTFYITWYSLYFGFLTNITVHAWTSTIGYQLFMSEGILVMYSKNTYTFNVKDRSMKRRYHWILQAIGSFLGIFGCAFEFYKREVGNRPHFSTAHSVTGKLLFKFKTHLKQVTSWIFSGLVSGIFLILTIISGCPALFSLELRRFIKPLFSKATHNLLSVLSYTTGMVSIINAYDTRWAIQNDPGEIRFIMIWCLSFILVFTLIGPLKTGYGQVKDLIAYFRSHSSSA